MKIKMKINKELFGHGRTEFHLIPEDDVDRYFIMNLEERAPPIGRFDDVWRWNHISYEGNEKLLKLHKEMKGNLNE